MTKCVGRCHWCSEDVTDTTFHHSHFNRICCTDCYTNTRSNYHRTYGEKADMDLERAEVLQARRRVDE